MRLLELNQGTPEWKTWRRDKLSASEAPVVMGCAPYYWTVKTVEQLKQKKLGVLNTKVNDYTKRIWAYGHETEHVARSCVLSQQYYPACIESDDGVFAASLDAHSANDAVVWSEIKCPYTKVRSSLWKHLMAKVDTGTQNVAPATAKNIVPDYIWWQMVHQSYVLFGDDCERSDLNQFNKGSLIVFLDRFTYINLIIEITEFMDDWELLKSAWCEFLDSI